MSIWDYKHIVWSRKETDMTEINEARKFYAYQMTHPGNGQLVRRRCTIENQFDLSRRTSWHV